MPIDSTLDELSRQQQPQQPLPPQQMGGGLDQLAQSQMTHQPERPNPAEPYLQAARNFATGGIMRAINPQSEGSWADYIAHGLSDAASIGAPFLGTLKLNRVPHNREWGSKDKFDLIHQETGDKRGSVWLTFDPRTKNLKVNFFQSNPNAMFKTNQATGRLVDTRKFALGKNPLDALVELKSALPDAFNHYPDMQTLEFYGIGGAKREQGVTANLKFKVWKTPDGNVQWEKIKHETSDKYNRTQPPSTTPVPAPEPEPLPPAPEPQNESWQQMRQRQNESWQQMQQRQDAEWTALMQRLFGQR